MSVGTQRAVKVIKLVAEIDAAMRQGVVYYRAAESSGDPQALDLLRRAVRLPYRIQARIQDAIARLGAPTINGYLAEVNGPTLAQLAAQLQPFLDYSDLLKDRYQNQGWTADQIAADIEANREPIDAEETIAIPAGYVDDL